MNGEILQGWMIFIPAISSNFRKFTYFIWRTNDLFLFDSVSVLKVLYCITIDNCIFAVLIDFHYIFNSLHEQYEHEDNVM